MSNTEITINSRVAGNPADMSIDELKVALGLSAPEPPPWPTLELLPGVLRLQGIKTRSVTKLDNNVVAGRAYRNLKINTIIGDDMTAEETELNGFNGQVRLDDSTLHLPAWSKSIGRTNHATGEFTVEAPQAHSPQIRGGGNINSNTAILGSFNNAGSLWEYQHREKILTQISYVSKEAHWDKGWYGGVGDGKGHVLFPNWYGTRLTKVNEVDGEFVVHQPDQEFLSGLDRHSPAKYSGGAYHEQTDQCVFFPRRGNAILVSKMGTDDGDREIPLPDELIKLFGPNSKSFDCFIGPDGLIYSVMWGANIMFRLDLSNDEITWQEFPDVKLDPGIAPGNGLYSRGVPIGNHAILAPTGMSQAAKLIF